MRKINYKGRTDKRMMAKCDGLCITYDAIQKKMTELLTNDKTIKEYRCNVPFDGMDYMSDIVATNMDDKIIVYECTTRTSLNRPSIGKMLDISRKYWLERGVNPKDWRLVIDEEKPIDEE